MATTSSTPRSASVANAMSPIGPQPNTATLSPGFASDWLTDCMPTASGSASAAVVRAMPSGTRKRRRPLAASGTCSSGVSPPCAAAGAHRPATAVGRAHDHPVADGDAGDLLADPLHDTGHLVAQRDRMPRDHAHVDVGDVGAADPAGRDADERVARSGLGSAMSSRRQSFAPCNMICFIGWVTSRSELVGFGDATSCDAVKASGDSGTGAVEHDAHQFGDPGVVDAGQAAQGRVEDRTVDQRGQHGGVDIGSQLTGGLGPLESLGDQARRRGRLRSAALAPFGRGSLSSPAIAASAAGR